MPVATPKRAIASNLLENLAAKNLAIGEQYLINRLTGPIRVGTILDKRTNKLGIHEVYVSYAGEDKRLDAWVKESDVSDSFAGPSASVPPPEGGEGSDTHKSKKVRVDKATPTPVRGRPPVGDLEQPVASSSKTQSARRGNDHSPSAPSTPEREHASMTRVRNFEDVRFGEYLVKTWYYSPYPFPLEETQLPPVLASTVPMANGKRKHAAANGHSDSLDANGPASVQKQKAATRTASDMFAAGVGKGGEGVRGRLWACDLCFKYMRTRDGWERHTSACNQLQPPGRKVYQRASYTIWEIDGAEARLYCQNLSLFGKLFIDHKSVFFHVENFLFYVLCDAATSRRDQVMAFFSKEKFSYDDYNLACIVTFPPHQNRGFGKLLIEFSYYLTLHPSTRPTSLSPGTPERPLSDLGLKSYTAYWASIILRFLRKLLGQAKLLPSILKTPSPKKASAVLIGSAKPAGSQRSLRVRNELGEVGPSGGSSGERERPAPIEKEMVNGIEIIKTRIPAHKSQYSISLTLKSISKACHLRIDDTAFTLSELGFLQHRRPLPKGRVGRPPKISIDAGSTSSKNEELDDDDLEYDLGEWKDIQIVISREMVERECAIWRVLDQPVLDEDYVLL